MARKLSARFRAIKKALLLVAVAGVAFAGCDAASHAPRAALAGLQVIDAAALPSPTLAFEAPPPADAPRRIVSLIPSVTETLFVLGLGDRIVGRSHWCDYPAEATTRPSTGRQEAINLEKVADLRPDVVFVWRHLPDVARTLRETFGLRVVSPGTENREEIFDGIDATARACGVPERGAVLLAEIRRGLEDARRRWGARPPRRTLLLLDRNPLFAPGPGSFLDELMTTVGAVNVAAAPGGPSWAHFSPERILDWDPEVVLDLSLGDGAGVEEARAFWSRFPRVTAVREGRVRLVAQGVLVRPGPRLAAVAELLGKLVHDG
ncbi:MAG TPA: helical backbone metal receptor [Planctomycetota bacterium]|nr:helical backbone metal receptor [Planctomycetota bacterium]